MSSDLYVTASELAAWIDDAGLNNLTDASGKTRDVLLETLVEAASRQVDADCGRIFYKQTATKRRHYPDLSGTVHVVDLLATPTPTIEYNVSGDETTFSTLATTDYLLLPRTEEGGTIAATRYQMIRAGRFGGYVFLPGYALDVTGSWGYVDADGRAPAGIRTAALIMAARLYMRRHAKLGRAVVLEAGLSEGLSATDPDYQAQIEPFRHQSVRFGMA